MHKTLLAVTFVLLGFGSGESVAATPFRLGFQGGINLANASLDPDLTGASKSSRTTFAVGAIAEVGASDAISIVAEPMYIQKGFELEGGGVKVILKPSFFEIPVLLKAKFGTSEIKPYLFAGPSIGFTTSSKIEVSFGGFSGEVDSKDSTASTDVSIMFGGGIEFDLNESISLLTDVRYSLGLTDINDAPATIPAKIKTNGVQILVGILFRVGN